jgi:hypothetical protein
MPMYIEAFREMLSTDSSRQVADMAVRAIEHDQEKLKAVLDLCFMEEYPISMRASRVIELYCENLPSCLDDYLDEIAPKILNSNVDGVKRNFLKILAEGADISRITEPGILLNTCFDWMMSPREKPAVRVYAMEIIFRFAIMEPPLRQELQATLEMLLPESPEPSIRSRGGKILKKLRKFNA